MSLFKQFQNCLNNKDFNSELDFNSFMFCRFLGSNDQTIQYANFLNCYYKSIPDNVQYDFIRFSNKPKFIKFISQNKKDSSPEILNLQKEYSINKERAREYLEILKLSNPSHT